MSRNENTHQIPKSQPGPKASVPEGESRHVEAPPDREAMMLVNAGLVGPVNLGLAANVLFGQRGRRSRRSSEHPGPAERS